MGSAASALSGGTHAIQWNPAGIARATTPMAQLGLGYNPTIPTFQVNTSILYPVPDGTVFGLSQFSDFPSGHPSSTTYVGSVALPLNSTQDFFVGLNLKYLAVSDFSGLTVQNGRGLGLDLGLVYDLRRPEGTIASFALAIKDVDTHLRFDNNNEQTLTRTFVLGAAYQNIPDTRIEMDFDIVDQTQQGSLLHNRLRLGAERFFADRFYSVRLGYDDLFNNDGYFSVGAGYHPNQPFELSYALRASTARSEISHTLSFIYRFDDLFKNKGTVSAAPPASSAEINLQASADLDNTLKSAGKPVSGVPLRKMTIRVDPPAFSPSGRRNTTTISFPGDQTPDVARWLLVIQAPDQKPVRRIGGTGPLVPLVAWDGLNEEGKQVTDGKYRIVLKTLNRKGEVLSDDSSDVEVISARSHFEIQTTGDVFSTRFGKKRKNDVIFTVNPGGSSTVQSWDFEISEASTNKVVYETKGQLKLPKTLRWNGRDLNKTPVQDGTYLCLLIAQDNAGNSLKADALKITIDNTPPELTLRGEDNLTDFESRKNFRWNLDTADRSGIQGWKLAITGERGVVLRTFEGTGQPPRETLWDGMTAQGKTVEPGSLVQGTLTATDKAGNTASAEPFPVQLDFKPQGGGAQMTLNLTTVYFKALSSELSEPSKKEIEKSASSIRPYLNKSVLVVKGYAAPSETGDTLSLSRNRAVEVKKYLVKTLSLSPGAVFAIGYATREPSKSAASPTTDENQRRAVITLTTQP